MGMKNKRTIGITIYHILVCIGGLIMVYPLIWMLMSSFKETNTIFATAKELLPEKATLVNYVNGWKGFAGSTFGRFFANSAIISVLSTVGAVASSAIVGYGFARCRFKGKKPLFTCMMVSMMLPFQVMMIPQFIWFKKLGWVGTYLPLIAPYFFGQGFFIFLIMPFIEGIPRELDEAAKIDGCSYYGVFRQIILPLIIPALITSGIFSFIWRWDDFMSPLLYINKTTMYPISYALKLFCDPSSTSDYGAMFAMATLSLLPAVIIFITLQKYLVEGIATSGIKG